MIELTQICIRNPKNELCWYCTIRRRQHRIFWGDISYFRPLNFSITHKKNDPCRLERHRSLGIFYREHFLPDMWKIEAKKNMCNTYSDRHGRYKQKHTTFSTGFFLYKWGGGQQLPLHTHGIFLFLFTNNWYRYSRNKKGTYRY